MIKKFLSRKFLYPILYALLVIGNRKMGLGLSETELISIAAPISAYIAGEALIDLKRK